MYRKSVEKLLRFYSNDISFEVKDEDLYKKIYWDYTLGLGESYVDGFIKADTENLIKLCKLFYDIFADYKLNPNNQNQNPILSLGYSKKLVLNWIARNLLNFQKLRPLHYADIHYNLNNKLFVKMLGQNLGYSCGFWKYLEKVISLINLNQAQNAKFGIIKDKLNLKSGDIIVNFGSGWGSLEQFLAQFGVICIGINISTEQLKFSRELMKDSNDIYFIEDNLLTSNNPFHLKEVISPILEKYGKNHADHIISIGAFEHVGIKNYTNLFAQFKNAIKDDGLMLIHTIGAYFDMSLSDPYIEKYIFPDTRVPTISETTTNSEKVGLKMVDYHNFEQEDEISYYALTLRCWLDNFRATSDELGVSEVFKRRWIFYLCLCIGLFESKQVLTVAQYIFQKTTNTSSYSIKR